MYIFFLFFSEKIRLDIFCESSARQSSHMKFKIVFSLKNNKVNLRMSSAVQCSRNNRKGSFLYGVVHMIGTVPATTQQTHDVATTSLQRRCNVVTLQRRCNDVTATLCVCWGETVSPGYMRTVKIQNSQRGNIV